MENLQTIPAKKYCTNNYYSFITKDIHGGDQPEEKKEKPVQRMYSVELRKLKSVM